MKDNKNFERIYEDLIDLHTKKIVVYLNVEDSYVYVDPEFKERLDGDTLKELFLKGMLVGCMEGQYAHPIGMILYPDTGAVAISTASVSIDGSAHVAGVIAYSKEYVAE